MADDRSDPTDDVPEADLLEQRAAATAAAASDEGDDAVDPAAMEQSFDTADPADRQEQLMPVGEDDDDYPRS